MRCFKCAAENSETRKYCRECGSRIVNFCPRCGFPNSLTDKYCGGCGFNLAELKTPAEKEGLAPQMADVKSGKYSADDISELVDRSPQKKKKKEIKDTEELSQDAIDNMFGSDNSDKNKKEK
ncbi:MAG: zinc ribbon domain-containing protein [Nitrospirota bacterium]